MADAPELPEAKDPFEKTIALTIAIIAVVLSFVENQGDNAKTDAIVKTGEMSNQWAYYQSKSLKENLAETSATLLGNLTPTAPDAAKAKAEELRAEVVRYEGAEHGFVHDPGRPAHRPDDAADAWRRAIAFLEA